MAATTAYSGIDGTVSLGGTTYNILSWSLSQTLETKDTTDSGSVSSSVAWATAVSSGVKRWSGSFEMIKNDGVAAILVGATGSLILKMNATDNFTGNCIVTSVDTNTTVIEGDVIKESVSFIGNGAITETNS